MLMQIPGAIGYVELAYAQTNKLKTVALKNRSGRFVQPNIEGIMASTHHLNAQSSDVTLSITNAQGKEVYPISAFTYILLPKTNENMAKLKEVKKFLRWALGQKQQEWVKKLHYAPLPKVLAQRTWAKLE